MDRHWAIGLLLLAIVVFLWVASGFFVNAMGGEYTKPYLVTYMNTSLMAIYLPWGWRQQKAHAAESRFSIWQTAKLSALFFVLWFASNLLNNASYYYTTVQSATIISCSSSFFTLLVGAYIGVEHFSLNKVGPLLISFGGIALITKEDTVKTAPESSLWGNLLALGSAFLYGVYTTLLKKQVGAETNLNTKLFFGFVGVFTFFGLWPLIWLLNWLGIETFELPHSGRILWLLALNGVAIIVSDFCWVRSMLMTSPLVVSVGLSATIPLSMLGEMLIYRRYISGFYMFGAALVGYSFWAINRSEEEDEHESH